MSDADDRLEILDLIGRYSFAADGSSAEAYADVYCDDGEFVGRTGQPDEIHIRGREAIVRFHQGVQQNRREGWQTRHHQSSPILVSLEGDRAVARSYLLTTSAGPDGAVSLGLTSIYEDHLVRTENGWRIAQRKALPDVKGVLSQRRRQS